jgi:hypothetical protein
MLLLYPFHGFFPFPFLFSMGDFGDSDVLGTFGDFGDFAMGFDFAFAGRLCFFNTLAFSSLANSDFRIS